MSTPMPWVKVYTEILDDHKFARLPDARRWQFIELLMVAGECDADGYLVNGNELMSECDIAWRLRRSEQEMIDILNDLGQLGLVTFHDGAYLIPKFASRQGRPQHERRQQWRDAQHRHRDRKDEEAPAPMPDEPPPELYAEETDSEPEPYDTTPPVMHDATMTQHDVISPSYAREEKRREEEKGRANARDGPSNGLTEGQRAYLTLFGAKRFKNTVQREAVLALEREYGAARLIEAGCWAATKGLALGQSIGAIQKALLTWGQPKDSGTTVVRGI